MSKSYENKLKYNTVYNKKIVECTCGYVGRYDNSFKHIKKNIHYKKLFELFTNELNAIYLNDI